MYRLNMLASFIKSGLECSAVDALTAWKFAYFVLTLIGAFRYGFLPEDLDVCHIGSVQSYHILEMWAGRVFVTM